MDAAVAGTPRTPGHDADGDLDGDLDDAEHGRWARHVDSLRRRRRLRRRLAAVLAVAGIVAIIVGLTWHPGRHAAGEGQGQSQPVTVNGSVTQNTAKPPTAGPGGVGTNPAKTGLPALPDGGRVRTGTKAQGCFDTMREYLDAWDKTGVEPDPCFTTQDPAGQSQPSGVVRSYNGQKF
jgi:hypothetical protein